MTIRRFSVLLAALLVLLSVSACVGPVQHKAGTPAPENEAIELPEDFSFSIVWNTYGISSYDSASGKLVKTKDTEHIGKYTKYVKMSEEELKTVYRYLFVDIDLTAYPDEFDPFNAPGAEIIYTSEPNQTVILSATANGVTKTVTCEKIAYGTPNSCYSEEARQFMLAKGKIVSLITSFPEWEAFPDYENYYD